MLFTMLCCTYPFERREDDDDDPRTQTRIMQRILKGVGLRMTPLSNVGLVVCAPLLCRTSAASQKVQLAQHLLLHARTKRTFGSVSQAT